MPHKVPVTQPASSQHSAAHAAAGGGSEVVATGPTASGPCVITATVAFANSSTLTANATITVVGMTSLAVAALDFNTIALPQPLLHSQLLAGDSLVLLKCDATNYEQVCVHAAANSVRSWHEGALFSDTCRARRHCEAIAACISKQRCCSNCLPDLRVLMLVLLLCACRERCGVWVC
jgi:hypothetical protein